MIAQSWSSALRVTDPLQMMGFCCRHLHRTRPLLKALRAHGLEYDDGSGNREEGRSQPSLAYARDIGAALNARIFGRAGRSSGQRRIQVRSRRLLWTAVPKTIEIIAHRYESPTAAGGTVFDHRWEIRNVPRERP